MPTTRILNLTVQLTTMTIGEDNLVELLPNDEPKKKII